MPEYVFRHTVLGLIAHSNSVIHIVEALTFSVKRVSTFRACIVEKHISYQPRT